MTPKGRLGTDKVNRATNRTVTKDPRGGCTCPCVLPTPHRQSRRQRKVKVNPAAPAAARERIIEQCKTPEEFVKQIVYEGVFEDLVQFATQLPDTSA